MNDSYHSMFDKVILSDSRKQEILKLTKESQYSHKRYSIRRLCLAPAACMAVMLIFILGPTRVYADKVFHELQGLIHINNQKVELGVSEWLKVTMPEDIKCLDYDGTRYEYKNYDTITAMEEELQINILSLEKEDALTNETIIFQVEDGQAGSINIRLDQEALVDSVLPSRSTLYFSTSKDVSTGSLTFVDVDNSYLTYTVEENEVVIHTKINYDIIETYQSSNLDTNVLILRNKVNSVKDEESGTNIGYWAVFVYDNIEYQLYFENEVDDIKEAIEQMK